MKRKSFTLSDEIATFFDIKTQGMSQSALITILIEKWLLGSQEVAAEYELYINSIRADRAQCMKDHHWSKYPEAAAVIKTKTKK